MAKWDEISSADCRSSGKLAVMDFSKRLQPFQDGVSPNFTSIQSASWANRWQIGAAGCVGSNRFQMGSRFFQVFQPVVPPVDVAAIQFGANENVLHGVAHVHGEASGITALIDGRGVALGFKPEMAELVCENRIIVFFGGLGRVDQDEMILSVGDAHRFGSGKLRGEPGTLKYLSYNFSRGGILQWLRVRGDAQNEDLALVEPFNFGPPIVEYGGLREK